MGLLLSILVFSVGVLEALACVRHIQQGILPAWAPRHVTSASGRRLLREQWRKSTSGDEGELEGGEEKPPRPRPPPLQIGDPLHHVRSPDIHWPELVPHSPVKTVQPLIPSPVAEVPGDAPSWPVNPPDPASLHRSISTANTLPDEDQAPSDPVKIVEEFVDEVPDHTPAWPVDPPDPASLLHSTSSTEFVLHEALPDSFSQSSTKIDGTVAEVLEDVSTWPVHHSELGNSSTEEFLLQEEPNQAPFFHEELTKIDQEGHKAAPAWPVEPPDPAGLHRRTSVTETLPPEEQGEARPLRDVTPEASFASEGREPARHKPAKASSFEEARVETFQGAEPKAPQVVDVSSSGPKDTQIVDFSSSGPKDTQIVDFSSSGPKATQIVDFSSSGPKATQVVDFSSSGPKATQVVDVSSSGPKATQIVDFSSSGPKATQVVDVSSSEPKATQVVDVSSSGPKTTQIVDVSSSGPKTPQAVDVSSPAPRPAAVRGRMHITAPKEVVEDNDPAPWPIINIDTVVTSDEEGNVTPPSNVGSRRVSFDPVPTVVVIDNEKPITEERERGTILAPSFMITDDFEGVLRKELPKVIDDIIQEAVFKVNQVMEGRQNGPLGDTSLILESLVTKSGRVLKGALASVCAEEYKDRYEPTVEPVLEELIPHKDQQSVHILEDHLDGSIDENETETKIEMVTPPAEGITVISSTTDEAVEQSNATLSPSGTDEYSPDFVPYSDKSFSEKDTPLLVDNRLESSSPSIDVDAEQRDQDQYSETVIKKCYDDFLGSSLAKQVASENEGDVPKDISEVDAITNETNDLIIRDDETNENQRTNALEDGPLQQSAPAASHLSAFRAEDDAATPPSTPVFSPKSRDEAPPVSSRASDTFSEVLSVAAAAVDIPSSTSISPNSTLPDHSIPIPSSIPDADTSVTSPADTASFITIPSPADTSSSAASISQSTPPYPVTPASSSVAASSVPLVTVPSPSPFPSPNTTATSFSAAVTSDVSTPSIPDFSPTSFTQPISKAASPVPVATSDVPVAPSLPVSPAVPVSPGVPTVPVAPVPSVVPVTPGSPAIPVESTPSADLTDRVAPISVRTSVSPAVTVAPTDSTPSLDSDSRSATSVSSHSTPLIATPTSRSADVSQSTSEVAPPRSSKPPAPVPRAPSGAQLDVKATSGERSSSGIAASAAPAQPQSEAFWVSDAAPLPPTPVAASASKSPTPLKKTVGPRVPPPKPLLPSVSTDPVVIPKARPRSELPKPSLSMSPSKSFPSPEFIKTSSTPKTSPPVYTQKSLTRSSPSGDSSPFGPKIKSSPHTSEPKPEPPPERPASPFGPMVESTRFGAKVESSSRPSFYKPVSTSAASSFPYSVRLRSTPIRADSSPSSEAVPAPEQETPDDAGAGPQTAPPSDASPAPASPPPPSRDPQVVVRRLAELRRSDPAAAQDVLLSFLGFKFPNS